LMLRVEERMGVGAGHPLRANSLATWCGESAYSMSAVGDGGLAIGPFQIHPGYANLCLGRTYGARPDRANYDLRSDPTRALECFLEQVKRIYEKAPCSGAQRWHYAEVWFARGVKPVAPSRNGAVLVPDCGRESKHIVRLKIWQEIASVRIASAE